MAIERHAVGLGTISNLEQNNRRQQKYVAGHDAAIEAAVEYYLEAEAGR